MTNIEDIRKEYELKIQAAEIENRLEAETGIKCNCFPFTWKNNTVFHASFSDSNKVLSLVDAAKILRTLPQTEEMLIRGTDSQESQRYKLVSKRGYNENFSKLEVRYLSDSVEIIFSINLEENESIRGLFKNGFRKLTSSEISTYNVRSSHIRAVGIPQLLFYGGKQIAYQGGDVVCNENSMINQIISAIQYAGEFSQE